MPHIKPLTGLRIVAALLVVMFHFFPAYLMNEPGLPRAASQVFHNLVKNGYAGVSFFFLLSGFILTYNYLGPRGRLRAGARTFWLARFARIYPIYIVAFVYAAPIFFWSGHGPAVCGGASKSLLTAVTSLLLVQSWLPCSEGVWNAPSWSLSAEAFFYLLFPLIVPLLGRLRVRSLIAIAMAAWLALAAIAVGYLVIAPDGPIHSSIWAGYFWLKAIYANPLARLPEFVIGAALGRLFLLQMSGGTAWRRPRHAGALSIVALIGVVAALAMGPLPIVLFNQIILDPLFALLIYSLAFNEGPVASFFSARPLMLLGDASYAVYILHWPTWYLLLHFIQQADPQFKTSAPYFFAYLGLVIVLALVSYRFVETPARRAIRGVFARRREEAAVDESAAGQEGAGASSAA